MPLHAAQGQPAFRFHLSLQNLPAIHGKTNFFVLNLARKGSGYVMLL